MNAKRWTCVALATAFAAVTNCALAQNWTGSGDMIWTQPDSNSFSSEYINGATATFLDAGVGTVTIDAGGVTPGAVIVNTTGTYTFRGGSIGGTGSLTKTGSGTLIITNANSFSGGIFLNSGKLQLNPGSTAASLGDPTNVLTFTGNSTFYISQFDPTLSQGVAVNGVSASFSGNAGRVFTINGALTGSGSVSISGGGTKMYCYFNSISNTFSGNLSVSGGFDDHQLRMNSLADSPGSSLRLGNDARFVYFTYGPGAVAPLVLSNRKIQLGGTTGGAGIYNSAANANATVTINTDLEITGVGAKTLTIGGSHTGNNTFAGAITNGSSSVISLTKADPGTWAIGGTNTYSGTTTINGGTLVFQGKQALPAASAISIGGGSTTKFLDDGTGTISLGNNVSFTTQNFTMYFFVGNNNTSNGGTSSGTTTGSTIALGNYNFFDHTDVYNRTLNVTGANGYRLQLGDVLLFTQGGNQLLSVPDSREAGVINASTAPITVTGTVIQRSGKTGYDSARRARFDYFTLDGTGTLNRVSGTIKDALDYPSNPNATPLGVWKKGTGEWTLSGTNTYSGATAITAGKLVYEVGASCMNSDVMASGGTLSVLVTNTTQQWICKSLSHTGASTLEFAFGAIVPSTTFAPLLVTGNVVFVVSPTVSCTGAGLSALPPGVYPLIKWGGQMSGLTPSTVTLTSGIGSLIKDDANKTLWLNIFRSTASKQPLTWKGSSSTWVVGGVDYTKWQDATSVYTNYQENTVDSVLVGDSVVFGATSAGTVTLNTTVSPAAISVNAGTPTNYTITGSGTIAGGGSLTKAGTCTLTLNTANTFSGGTVVGAGTLVVGNASALGTGTIFLSGGTIQNSDATARILDNTVVLNGSSTIGGTGNLTFSNVGAGSVPANSTITVTNSGVNATIATALSGAGSITKAGPGTVTLSGANTYSGGITLSGGKLVAVGASALGTGAITWATTGTTLQFNSDSNLTAGNGWTTSGRSLARTLVLDRLTSGDASGLTYTFSSQFSIDTGCTLTFSAGSNITSGTPTIDFSNATRGFHSSDSNVGTITLTPNGVNFRANGFSNTRGRTVVLDGTSAGNEMYGVMSDGNAALNITKSGTSTWTLSGANTYTGATTINNGKLKVATGSGTRCASAVAIANTAGCIFGVQLATAYGQWTSSSTLTVGGVNSEIDIDYGSTAPTNSLSYDPIKVTTLTVNGKGTLKILSSAPTQFKTGMSYPLINFTTSGPAVADPYTGLALVLPTGVTGYLKTSANHVELVITTKSGTLIQFM